MTRVPQIEAALRKAAAQERFPDQLWGRRSPQTARLRRGLLALLALLAVSGAAVAAVSGILDTGSSVPAVSVPSGRLQPPAGNAGHIAHLRVSDPDGGLPWGLSTYPVDDGRATCVAVGRVQQGHIGVLGRDGAFANDGKFHPLLPRSDQSYACAGVLPSGANIADIAGPPVPASGYTGRPGPPVGGCRERIDLNSSTVSPQTRRRLREVPMCAESSLRIVRYGFAGRQAREVTASNDRVRRSLRVDPRDSGAYLFVLRPQDVGEQPLRVLATDANGRRLPPPGLRTHP